MRTLIADGYHELVQQKKVITVDAIKSLFLGDDENEMTLIKLGEYHNTEMKDKLPDGTMKNYYTTQKYIVKFLKEKHRRADINLAELNYKFIADFETFLSKHQPKDHQKPLHNNGIMKHLERLCKMVNMAVTMDWIAKDPFAKFKQHFDKVERFYLIQKCSLSRVFWQTNIISKCDPHHYLSIMIYGVLYHQIAIMETITPGTQLEYELQDLYISSKHWLSDVCFMADEIRFFKDLINKYFIPAAKKDPGTEVKHFQKTIAEKESETVVLRSMVIAYLNFLEPFTRDLKQAIGFDLIEKHSFLENQIKEQFASLRSFKKDLFAVAEKIK